MEKTCKNESLPSRDWVCLDRERFASHPQLSPRNGAQKALVITGFFWSGQVFLLLGMLGDWWSLVCWCPTTPRWSLWVSLFSLPRETCRNQQAWEGHWERAPGQIQVEARSGGCWCRFYDSMTCNNIFLRCFTLSPFRTWVLTTRLLPVLRDSS